MRTFLIGGGRDPDLAAAVHEPFVAASGGPVVAFALDDPDRWAATLTAAGASDPRVVLVSADRPPTRDDLAGARGVYVAGGLTPAYRDVLTATDWLDRDLVYAGYSAGAAVAAERALVGGWRVGAVEVCPEDASEDLDQITVAPGLGLVPFAVDVHAAQWGTLHRLVHAVRAGLVEDGWAVDEHTALEVHDGTLTVHGAGAATHVWRDRAAMRLDVHLAG